MKNITLVEFLRIISSCDGDDAIKIIYAFQSGNLKIENISIYDIGAN